MGQKIMRLFFLLLVVSQIAATCKGTETGNPSDNQTYSSKDFGVSSQYASNWSATEKSATTLDSTGEDQQASSAIFTDGTSTVTLYFVTLSKEPESLQAYLALAFPSRTVKEFSNSNLSGFMYDNPETGLTGGDLQEYYFLKGKLLLYVVTDLFEKNDGVKKFDTILTSLKFQ